MFKSVDYRRSKPTGLKGMLFAIDFSFVNNDYRHRLINKLEDPHLEQATPGRSRRNRYRRGH